MQWLPDQLPAVCHAECPTAPPGASLSPSAHLEPVMQGTEYSQLTFQPRWAKDDQWFTRWTFCDLTEGGTVLPHVLQGGKVERSSRPEGSLCQQHLQNVRCSHCYPRTLRRKCQCSAYSQRWADPALNVNSSVVSYYQSFQSAGLLNVLTTICLFPSYSYKQVKWFYVNSLCISMWFSMN